MTTTMFLGGFFMFCAVVILVGAIENRALGWLAAGSVFVGTILFASVDPEQPVTASSYFVHENFCDAVSLRLKLIPPEELRDDLAEELSATLRSVATQSVSLCVKEEPEACLRTIADSRSGDGDLLTALQATGRAISDRACHATP